MKRTQIQLDEQTWEELRKRAFQQKSSVAALIREMLREQTTPKKKQKKLRMEDLTFIDSGRSQGKGAGTISERHDEEFADSLYDFD